MKDNGKKMTIVMLTLIGRTVIVPRTVVNILAPEMPQFSCVVLLHITCHFFLPKLDRTLKNLAAFYEKMVLIKI